LPPGRHTAGADENRWFRLPRLPGEIRRASSKRRRGIPTHWDTHNAHSPILLSYGFLTMERATRFHLAAGLAVPTLLRFGSLQAFRPPMYEVSLGGRRAVFIRAVCLSQLNIDSQAAPDRVLSYVYKVLAHPSQFFCVSSCPLLSFLVVISNLKYHGCRRD
jgi:hypothetical protein